MTNPTHGQLNVVRFTRSWPGNEQATGKKRGLSRSSLAVENGARKEMRRGGDFVESERWLLARLGRPTFSLRRWFKATTAAAATPGLGATETLRRWSASLSCVPLSDFEVLPDTRSVALKNYWQRRSRCTWVHLKLSFGALALPHRHHSVDRLVKTQVGISAHCQGVARNSPLHDPFVDCLGPQIICVEFLYCKIDTLLEVQPRTTSTSSNTYMTPPQGGNINAPPVGARTPNHIKRTHPSYIDHAFTLSPCVRWSAALMETRARLSLRVSQPVSTQLDRLDPLKAPCREDDRLID